MFLIDITYPEGALDADARTAIAAQITASMTGEANDAAPAPESTMKRGRAMTHVVFHPAESWATGDGPLADDRPPPYLVTVTVPEAWREEIASYDIPLIQDVLTRHDPPGLPGREGGDIWVNVVGVADGGIGLNGAPATADDVLMYMTSEYRANPTTGDLPEGTVVDPICGMYVKLGPHAVTLDHDGQVVGFCSRGCRAAYGHQHDIEVPTA